MALKSINPKMQEISVNESYLIQDIIAFAKHKEIKLTYFNPAINMKFEIGKTALHMTLENKNYWFVAEGYFANERTFKCVYFE